MRIGRRKRRRKRGLLTLLGEKVCFGNTSFTSEDAHWQGTGPPVNKKKRKTVPEAIVQATVEIESHSKQTNQTKKEKKKKRGLEVSESSTPVSETQPGSTTPILTPASPPSSVEAQAFLKKHSIKITTPDNLPSIAPVITFDQLDIPEGLRVAFTGFKEPSPIQACTWPPALEGRDVVGIAETGR